MGDKVIHNATRSFLTSSNPRLTAAMGGNNKLQLALDIAFNDSDDDNTKDSSPENDGGKAAPAAAREDNGAPPALHTGREQPPPPTDDAFISTSPQTPIKRTKYYWRVRKMDCNWWRLFLSPEALPAYMDEPGGHLSRKFHCMFRTSYDIFKRRVLDLAVETWW